METREHPPSSLEGVEQPSEVTERKKPHKNKKLVAIYFSDCSTHITELSNKQNKPFCTANRVINLFLTMFQEGRNFLIVVQIRECHNFE